MKKTLMIVAALVATFCVIVIAMMVGGEALQKEWELQP